MTTNSNTTDLAIPAFLDRKQNGVQPVAKPQSVGAAATPQTETAQPAKPARKAAKPSPAARKATVKALAKQAKDGNAKATGKKAKAAVAAVVGDGSQTKNPRSIVPVSFKQVYKAFSGTCGDNVAMALKLATTTKNKDGRDCLDVAALKRIARENKVDFTPYEKLNNGQKRMNVGNKLRGIIEQSGKVVIDGKVFGTVSDAASAAAAKLKAQFDKGATKRA